MSKYLRLGAMTAAVAGLVAVTSTASFAKECKAFAAVGSGLNNDVATLMAMQGAVNVAEGRGYTVQGEAKLISCYPGGIFGTECKASTYACIMPK